MRKAADLLKKLIVQIDTGDIVGKVEDLLLDPEQDRLAALITMSGRWLREAALIPWERIIVCTGDVILVQPGTEPQAASALPPLQRLLERKIHVSGTRVLTASGDKVGTVGEMLIDGGGRIKGYAISRGFLGAERQFVAAEDVEAIGADALIVRDDAARDTLEDETPASGYPADELRQEIVMPLTGTRIPTSLPALHEPPPPSPPAPEPAPGGFAAYTGPTIFAERPEAPEPALAPEPAVLAAPRGWSAGSSPFEEEGALAPEDLLPPAFGGEAHGGLPETPAANLAGTAAAADQPPAPPADQPPAPEPERGAPAGPEAAAEPIPPAPGAGAPWAVAGAEAPPLAGADAAPGDGAGSEDDQPPAL